MFGPKIAKVHGDGRFAMEVRGESHYQRALERVAKSRSAPGEPVYTSARLTPERNRHDPNAVRVEIDGRKVGYIPKELSAGFRHALKVHEIGGVVQCPAVVRGGRQVGREYYPFGVRLDLPDGIMREIVAYRPAARKKGCGCFGLVVLGTIIKLGIIGSFVFYRMI